MAGPYARPVHGSAGNDGSATDATVIIGELSAGLEDVEQGLQDEADARAAADTDLAASIGVVGDDLMALQGALSGEATARAAADTSLADAIGAVGDLTATKVPLSALTDMSLLGAVSEGVPAALTVPASTLVGRADAGGIAALTPAVVRALLSVVDLSTLGNRLTSAQATPSTGAYTLSGCTESGALVLTATGSGALSAGVASIPVTAGVVYTTRANLVCTGRSAAVWISWCDSGGAEISAVAGDTIAAGASGESMATGLAPSGAVTMTAYAAYSGTGAAGDTVAVTRAGVWVGAGGLWVPPGIAVPNLGIRTTRPNVDDVWVRAWSGRGGDPAAAGRWQTTHYDSGWRQVTALLNGWTPSSDGIQIRRTGSECYARIGWVNGTAATDDPFYAPPAGFRIPNFMYVVLGVTSGTTAADIVIDGGLGLRTSVRTATVFGLAMWHTDDAIPTALPGTLASAAPA